MVTAPTFFSELTWAIPRKLLAGMAIMPEHEQSDVRREQRLDPRTDPAGGRAIARGLRGAAAPGSGAEPQASAWPDTSADCLGP